MIYIYQEYLSFQQRKNFLYHVPVKSLITMRKAEDWCVHTIGNRRNRWDSFYMPIKIVEKSAAFGIFMFRAESDAVLFQLRWS